MNEKFCIQCLNWKDEWENITNKEWFDGISNIENIDSIRELNRGQELEVNYKNGEVVYYQKIHGTWGNRTVFK